MVRNRALVALWACLLTGTLAQADTPSTASKVNADLAFNASNPDSGCVRPAGFRRHYLICVDALNQALAPSNLPSGGHVINPNRPILVLVRHDQEYVKVVMDGKVGLLEPGIRKEVRGEQGVAPSGQEPPKEKNQQAKRVLVSQTAFAPREPGRADISVQVGPKDDPSQRQTIIIEVIVETTYAGAVRVGVASVFGGAVDRAYAVQARPGSGQAEIVATNNSMFDLELTLGFAPFLEFVNGGRAYHQGGKRWRFAPYVGIGLLNQKKNALEVLKSLHVGVEAEPNPHFSIALTLVGRQVTRLIPPATIGSPADPSGAPVSSGYKLGVGLVFNVSPEFLKFAAQDSSAFFQ